MVRRILVVLSLALMLPLASMAGIFHHGKNQNPLANVDSKQPDKVLFDRSMDFMKHSKYEQARTTLQVLINTYPDSEYIARAKLAIGDAWYNEGGTTGLAQAEIEYKDFITFFPNMPEAAEAQLKVANIHYRQMEKPDRDATHARRAEEEYQQLILQFPDSKLVPQAQQRLREVQEVLAEKEFGVGKQYFMRESWPAAIARLQTAVDTYPLYSKAPEALYMLGQIYDIQTKRIRDAKGLDEGKKAVLIINLSGKAEAAYDRIIMNYPLTPRASDAKRRLAQMNRGVPSPTSDAVEKDKALEASRRVPGRMDVIVHNFRRAPDVKQAAHTGEPTMTPQPEHSAVDEVRNTNALLNVAAGNSISVEVRKGPAGANDPVPTSNQANQPAMTSSQPAPEAPAPQPAAPAVAPPPADTGIPELKPIDSGAPAPQPAISAPVITQPSKPTMQTKGVWPSIISDPQSQVPAPAPAQINDAAHTEDGSAQAGNAQSAPQEQGGISSSKGKKKKKGLGKLNPF